MGPMPDPSYVARQRALLRRVEALWTQGILTGPLIQRAREDDHVITIDFEGSRFTLALYPRVEIARMVPAHSADEVFRAMASGQPPIKMGETVAAWFIATELVAGEPVAEVHGPLRAWRDAHGTA